MNREAGFTLVEALVSLFVFGLVSAGCVGLLMQSVETNRRVEAAHAALRELQLARAQFAQDLAQIAPRAVRLPEGGYASFQALAGAEPSLSFVRAVGDLDPAAVTPTRLVAVRYALDAEGRLVRTARVALDPGARAAEEGRPVFTEARNVSFAYHDGVDWREAWDSAAPPRAVAMVAELPRYGQVRIEALIGVGP